MEQLPQTEQLKVIICKGLPGAGKTAWAKGLAAIYPDTYVRVSKDDIRKLLHDSRWDQESEKLVLDAQDALIMTCLGRGKNVIVDNTNLAPKHESRIRNLVGDKVVVEIKDFTNVPLEECLERDKYRPNPVGEDTIRRMWQKYLAPPVPLIKHNPELPNCILVDIDGTLALRGDRGIYEFDKALTDSANPAVYKLVQLINVYSSLFTSSADKIYIVIVTGRKSKYRHLLEKWLQLYNISYKECFMRRTDDERKDSIIKKEIYDQYIRNTYNVVFVVEDRQRNVDMFRSLGLTVFQVAPGNF